mmetsp:Transcript_76283/g.192044  ORF Transcript_76283/g.192044 Transcript_76283/m.192044 type:complete len:231 (-) Transcript_76283:663-1355(-)
MKLSTNDFPMASSLPQPEISAAFWFHSVIKPLASMQKIGAFVVSIMRVQSAATCSLLCMASRKTVMSWPTPAQPVTFPSESLVGVAFSKISTLLPSFDTSIISKFALSSPCQARSRAQWTWYLFSSAMNSSMSIWPSASSLVKPDTSSAFLFHSVTRPVTSTPKIGAFAVWMKRARPSAMRCCSAIAVLISVMSCPTPMTPRTTPSALRRVVVLSKISRRWPSFVHNGKS